MLRFSISLVIYQPNISLLLQTLNSLTLAVERLGQAKTCQVKLVIFDNTLAYPQGTNIAGLIKTAWLGELVFIKSAANVGFGAGHNQALALCDSDYHLILNPDVVLDAEAILVALNYLEETPDVLLVSPYATWENGRRQYLCKRYPTVFDLVLRGFAPTWLKKLFTKRLARYEMQGVTEQDIVRSVPIVSGCCMWVRTAALKKTGGFSEDFFLYFEDFDLCLRLAQYGQLVYLPTAKIVHAGGNAARKGWRHIRLFLDSGRLFYKKNGWRWY